MTRLLRFLAGLIGGRRNPPLSEWFSVEFDSDRVCVFAAPPGADAWSQEFRWSDIERICFQAEDFTASDGIYVFTRLRPESFAIPIEARGGNEFWAEVLARGLFDEELALRAAGAVDGIFCWPPMSPEP